MRLYSNLNRIHFNTPRFAPLGVGYGEQDIYIRGVARFGIFVQAFLFYITVRFNFSYKCAVQEKKLSIIIKTYNFLAVLVPRLGPKGMAAVKKFTMLNR
jgi:hypothetical protein